MRGIGIPPLGGQHLPLSVKTGQSQLPDEDRHGDGDQGRRFRADDGNALFRAELDGVAVGFATAPRRQRFDARRAAVLIDDSGVAAAARRRGVGRALIAHRNAWGQRGGADQVWVLADGDDDRAPASSAGTGGDKADAGAAMFTGYLAAAPQ